MSKIWSIFFNEMKLFFYTPIAYMIGFGFYIINGVLFWYLINQGNVPGSAFYGTVLNHMTGGIVFWLTLFLLVPLISMRLIAFEAENKRLNHLFSTPVKTYEIVLGKYLAGLAIYSLLWVGTLIYFLLLWHYTVIDLNALFAAYCGLFLIGAFSMAIGLLASSLSNSQIGSAMLSFFLLLGILLISMFSHILPQSFLKESFQYLNYVDHLLPFSEGIVDTRDVVFFISMTVFFLITVNEILSLRRES